MLFVCDILEHFKEMIGQSAINRQSQDFVPNSLRGHEGKITEPWTHLRESSGRRAQQFVFVSAALFIVLAKSCYLKIVIIHFIAWGS